MQNNHKNTIKKMVIANEYLKNNILDNYPIDQEDNIIINIELFFLTFTLFSDCFRRIEMSEELKRIIEDQDYYIDGDKIILRDKVISFESLEKAFIETLLKYNEIKSSKIISYDPTRFFSKKTPQEAITGQETKIMPFNSKNYLEKKKNFQNEAIGILNSYKLDKDGKAISYLHEIKSNFRLVAYDSIVSLYYKLNIDRQDQAFKSYQSLLSNNSIKKYYIKFIYMLLNIYPLQIYAKNRDIIDYSSLLIEGIDADFNLYTSDEAWKEFERKINKLNLEIDNYLIFIRNRKVPESAKLKVRNRIDQIKLEKKLLSEQYMHEIINQSDMKEIIELDNREESVYSSSQLNKHILCDIENALKKGYIRIDKDKVVFYGIKDDKVDFIINIYNNMIMDIFDIDNVLKSLNNTHNQNGIKNDNKMLYKS